jgi:hypothetical protein
VTSLDGLTDTISRCLVFLLASVGPDKPSFRVSKVGSRGAGISGSVTSRDQ